MKRTHTILLAAALLNLAWLANAQTGGYEFNDSHFHLTNYVQNGTDIHTFLPMMGNKVGRVALFGIPLQQLWSYRVSGDNAPAYYLNADTPLYYYSFTDAQIAMAYRSLTKEEQARFDPMITGFNPTDMYAADHIRRVLQLFPGVFSGIGEFTIHKEFVSSKVAGDTASLTDPALDRILDFAAEVGLVALIHNDISTPFAKEETKPAYLEQMLALLRRHPKTTIIWAHTGLGRVVVPVKHHAAVLAAILAQPEFKHVYFDISWDQTARYILANPVSQAISAISSIAIPTASCSAPTKWHRPANLTICGYSSFMRPCGACLLRQPVRKFGKGTTSVFSMKLVIEFGPGRVHTQKQSGDVDGLAKSEQLTILMIDKLS